MLHLEISRAALKKKKKEKEISWGHSEGSWDSKTVGGFKVDLPNHLPKVHPKDDSKGHSKGHSETHSTNFETLLFGSSREIELECMNVSRN